MFSYRYTQIDGTPLQHCPGCQAFLTDEDSLTVELIRHHGETRWSEPAHLDDQGNLIELGSVARGFHSRTVCALCEEALCDFDEDVIEYQKLATDDRTPPIDDPEPLHLRVRFFDAKGVAIETFDAELPEALERIARFVVLHGTDPDEDGRGAKKGSIRFFPIRPEGQPKPSPKVHLADFIDEVIFKELPRDGRD